VRILTQIVLVGLGSAVGGVTRWGVGVGVGRWLGTAFPWGTLFINVSGSLFLGWIATLLAERLPANGGWIQRDDLQLLIAVGFTGGYTTFSTFEFEADGLIRQGQGFIGTVYLIGSVVLGLLAVRCGVLLARWQ
jgi:CrcB protein